MESVCRATGRGDGGEYRGVPLSRPFALISPNLTATGDGHPQYSPRRGPFCPASIFHERTVPGRDTPPSEGGMGFARAMDFPDDPPEKHEKTSMFSVIS